MVRFILAICISSIFLFSCDREKPVSPIQFSGTSILDTVSMNKDYRYQVFYDLTSMGVTAVNEKTAWDISISKENEMIRLNMSKAMYAAKTGNTELNEVNDTSGLTFLLDVPSGQPDSLAFKDWSLHTGKVYVLDKGYHYDGTHLGFEKMVIEKLKNDTLFLQHAPLNSNETKDVEIPLSDTHHDTYYSFNTGIVTIAPQKEEWTFCFTSYIHIFSDPVTHYSVTGVLINSASVDVALFKENIDYSDITVDDIMDLDYYSTQNTIGYDWKIYSFDTHTFEVDPNKIYIIKQGNSFWKLHFLDFYDSQGVKGHPLFEYETIFQ